MRIYLDNCCYNRPYDDKSLLTNNLESQAEWMYPMNSEIALADKCMRILYEYVGVLDAERFIHFITSNHFDYT